MHGVASLRISRATPVLDRVKIPAVGQVVSEECGVQHGARRASDESVLRHGSAFPDKYGEKTGVRQSGYGYPVCRDKNTAGGPSRPYVPPALQGPHTALRLVRRAEGSRLIEAEDASANFPTCPGSVILMILMILRLATMNPHQGKGPPAYRDHCSCCSIDQHKASVKEPSIR